MKECHWLKNHRQKGSTRLATELCRDLTDIERSAFFAICPSLRNVQGNIYKYIRQFIPKQPKDFSEFDTSVPWFNLTSGESIVKTGLNENDQNDDNELSKIVLFATNQTLKILADARAISVDGTFKMAPKLWKQLFIVCAEVPGGVWLPCAFGLLPDKKESTYIKFFYRLKEALVKINCELSAVYIMRDFELAIANSLETVWPEIQQKGCHFHMAKAIWKRISDAGLKSAYSQKGNDSLVEIVVSAIGMAYVPIEMIHDGKAYEELVKISRKLPKGIQKSFGKSFLKGCSKRDIQIPNIFSISSPL